MEEQEILKKQLEQLITEHRDLDSMIDDMLTHTIVNKLAVQRLKKRKLLVKDQIVKVRSQLLPDIIA